MKKLVVSLGVLAALAIPATAAWAGPEIGPCDDPDAIEVRLGDVATVCVAP